MKTIISYEIRKLAKFLLFAAKLVEENVRGFLEGLQEIVKDDKNFEKDAEPLTLSMMGFSKTNALIRGISLDKGTHNTVPKIMAFFLKSLNMAGREDKVMADLHRFIEPKWSNLRDVVDQKAVLDKLKQALTGMSLVVKRDS